MQSNDKTALSSVSAFGNPDTWFRGLMMLLLIVGFGVAQSLLYLTAFIQFFWLLFAKEHNSMLAQFGKSLAKWLSEIALFLSCASDKKPFPWSAWPKGD